MSNNRLIEVGEAIADVVHCRDMPIGNKQRICRMLEEYKYSLVEPLDNAEMSVVELHLSHEAARLQKFVERGVIHSGERVLRLRELIAERR